MNCKIADLRPFLILLAVALASILFVMACGDSAEPTAVAHTASAEAAEAAGLAAAVELAEGEEAEGAQPVEVAAAEVSEEAAQLEVPKYGGRLTLATSSDSYTLDPALWWAIADAFITQATYDNLLMIQPDLSLKPELATSWEPNDDHSSYTFHLRQGVKFHHGKDFKAEDVIFTFNRLLDPILDSPAKTLLRDIEDIVALDDYTVRFDLEGPNAFFPEYVSIELARILPADVDVERLIHEEFGTGPFIIVEHLPGERTSMVRNPDYWEEGKPYLDELVIMLIAEAATRAEALKSGDADIVWGLEPPKRHQRRSPS